MKERGKKRKATMKTTMKTPRKMLMGDPCGYAYHIILIKIPLPLPFCPPNLKHSPCY